MASLKDTTLLPRIVGMLTVVGGELCRTKTFEPDYSYTDQYIDFTEFDEIVVIRADKNPALSLASLFKGFVEGILPRCFLPLALGGWIRDREEAETLFDLGADRVVIGSAAIHSGNFIAQLASVWGSQAIIGSVAVIRHENQLWAVKSNAPNVPVARAEVVIRSMAESGVGEILINFVDRDGSLLGPDLEGAKQLASQADVPFVIAGGIGNWRHMHTVLSGLGASGVATSNIYHLSPQSIRSAKDYLTSQGISVRQTSQAFTQEAP